jgi:hypothetical protein
MTKTTEARKYIPTKKDGSAYDSSFEETIKLTDMLEEVVRVKGFKIVQTKFGEMIIIDTDKGRVSTYSKIVLSQLEAEQEKGLPVDVKFRHKNNYYTMAAP